jgi:predicted DCC family thiol-disulfide oxidoreductase YuxK
MTGTQSTVGTMAEAKATFFYNGACPFCRHGMQVYVDGDDEGRTAWCDAAAPEPPAMLRAHGVTHAAAKRRLHAIDAQGHLHAGIDAVAVLWETTPGQGGLARLARGPLRPLAGFIYDHMFSAVFYRWAEWRLARQRARPVAPAEAGAHGACAVYYNGACPVCGPEIERFRRAARQSAATFAWHDLATAPEALQARGVSAEAARRRLHAIDSQGRLHVGIDAFILIWQQLPRYRWLAPLVRLPVVHGVAIILYDHVLAPALAVLSERALHRSENQ